MKHARECQNLHSNFAFENVIFTGNSRVAPIENTEEGTMEEEGSKGGAREVHSPQCKLKWVSDCQLIAS